MRGRVSDRRRRGLPRPPRTSRSPAAARATRPSATASTRSSRGRSRPASASRRRSPSTAPASPTPPTRSSCKTDDPANELPRIDAYVHTQGGWLQGNCHVLMHSVGRRYGQHATGHADEPPGLPAEDERPGVLGRVRARDADRARAGDPEARAEGRGRRAATARRRATSATAASTGSATPTRGSSTTSSTRRSPRARSSGRTTRSTARRASSTTTGSPSPGSTARAGRPGRSSRRGSSAPPSPTGSCACAGTGRSSSGRRPAVSHSAGQLLATCSGLAGLQRSGCLTGASLIRSDDPAGAAAHLPRPPRRRGRRLPARAARPDVCARAVRDASSG